MPHDVCRHRGPRAWSGVGPSTPEESMLTGLTNPEGLRQRGSHRCPTAHHGPAILVSLLVPSLGCGVGAPEPRLWTRSGHGYRRGTPVHFRALRVRFTPEPHGSTPPEPGTQHSTLWPRK